MTFQWHIVSDKHKQLAAALSTVKPGGLDAYFARSTDDTVINAECLFTGFIVEHNLPVNASDHTGQLFRQMFPDSKIAAKYHCGRTKAQAIINTMAESSREEIAQSARTQPFSLATDGSNDGGGSQLYPVLITYFNETRGQVEQVLHSLPACKSDSTGENIFKLLEKELEKDGIPWSNCIAFGSDNASVMMGSKKGVMSYVLKKNASCKIIGCPCHMIHNTAQKAAKSMPLTVDEFLVDIFYYLDKSHKRLKNLKAKQVMCDAENKKILKHVSTRWLSLTQCIDRLLTQWEPLKLFFKDEVKSSVTKTVKSASSLTAPKAKPATSTSASVKAKAKTVNPTVTSARPSSAQVSSGASLPQQNQSLSMPTLPHNMKARQK